MIASRRSIPAVSNASMFARAIDTALGSSPACEANAPQHLWARGTITSHPFAVRTRTVASLVGANARGMMHPETIPTVMRDGPCDAKSSVEGVSKKWSLSGGAIFSMSAKLGGTRPIWVASWTMAGNGLCWYHRKREPTNARRSGCGNNCLNASQVSARRSGVARSLRIE